LKFWRRQLTPSVTLISCYPYLVDDQRIVVSARLETDSN
jgi:sortase (surface protein transpeptidase)